jgi:signal transduction histidine kinase
VRSAAPADHPGQPALTHVSTRALRTSDDALRSPPTRRRRILVPTRLRIMAWLVLLLLVALVTVVVVTRNLLLAQAQTSADDALNREAAEFRQAAAAGVDQETGARYRNGSELVERYISRHSLIDEVIVQGITREGTIVPQRGREAIALADRDSRWQQIVDNPANADVLQTRDGRLQWVKVPIVDDAGRPDGTFIAAYAIDVETGDIDDTIHTLVLVSAIGLLVAAIASWVVAGQILEPVNVVRRAAAQISHDDLTERIAVDGHDDIAALSEQFNGMLDRLEGAFGAQRRFLDDASHELRTPITIIRGNLEFVESDDPQERSEVVRLCTDELDRMSRIVEDLLLLAKAERPDFIKPADVGLVDLTSDVYAKVRMLGDRHWVLESIAEGEGRLDGQRVTQAVIQLAHNAVGHTRPGDAIRFGSSATDSEVSFWVADTGHGVPPEEGEAIFQRFSRGSGGGARANHTGAGLGLTIVTAIAEGHGGHVELRSVVGEGARFALHLPQPAGYRERIDDGEDSTA